MAMGRGPLGGGSGGFVECFFRRKEEDDEGYVTSNMRVRG